MAFFAQTSGNFLNGAWVILHFAGCAVLLYSDGTLPKRGAVWWATLAWLMAMLVQAFFIRPVANGAVIVWVLAAGPMLALCMKKEYLPNYLRMFMGIILIYIAGMYIQFALNCRYTLYQYGTFFGHMAPSWPLIDPNNAAALLNLALPAFVYAALFRPRWWLAVAALLPALVFMRSQAGDIVALLTLFTMLAYYLRPCRDLLWLAACFTGMAALPWLPNIIDKWHVSLAARWELWKVSFQMLQIAPVFGLGAGQFDVYYRFVRTELATSGYWVHNDPLQFALEFGIPALCVFAWLCWTMLRRAPVVALCGFCAVLLQSVTEFQFYVPAINLATGLPLAYAIFSEKRRILS